MGVDTKRSRRPRNSKETGVQANTDTQANAISKITGFSEIEELLLIISTKVRILGKMYLFHFQSMDIPKAPTAGISSRIPHTTEFTIFLDYDNIVDSRLVDELLYLQELHTLGDFHVLSSSEYNRHAICADRLPLREALDVIYSSTCDATFARGARINEYRTWILRGLEKGNRDKPKYLYSLESPYNGQRLQSQAHALFLQHYYGAKVRLTNPDGNGILEVQGYKTGSKIDLKEVLKAGKSTRQ